MAAETPNWLDLLDPSPEELRRCLPGTIHPSALELLEAPAQHGDEPRPQLAGHGDYVFGTFLVPVAVREEDRIYYQEIDLVLTLDTIVTVRKTPEGGEPFKIEDVKEAVRPGDPPGMIG